MIARTLALAALLALAGCGGGGSDAPADPTPSPKLITGFFFDTGGVKGLRYRSCALQSYTGPHGEFTYAQLPDCSVTFCLGTNCLGTIRLFGSSAGSPLTGRIVTPYDVDANPLVRNNFLRVLRALDVDGDASNGIEISAAVDRLLEQRTIDWTSADLAAALRDILIEANSLDGTAHVLPEAETAENEFFAAMRCLSSGLYRGTWNLAANGSSLFSRQGSFALLIAPRDSFASGVLLESVESTNDPRLCPYGIGCRDFPPFDFISAIHWSLADTLSIEPMLTDGNRILSGQQSYNYYVVGSDSSSSDEALFTLLPSLEPDPTAVMHFAGATVERYALELQIFRDDRVHAVIFDLNSPWVDPAANTVVNDPLAVLNGTLQGNVIHAHGTTASTRATQRTYDLDGAVDLASMTFQGTITEAGSTSPRARFDSSYPAYGCTLCSIPQYGLRPTAAGSADPMKRLVRYPR